MPLPERVETLPKRDYAVGQKVLALYPDTSCFYKATVKGGGPQMQKVPPSKVSFFPSSLRSASLENSKLFSPFATFHSWYVDGKEGT